VLDLGKKRKLYSCCGQGKRSIWAGRLVPGVDLFIHGQGRVLRVAQIVGGVGGEDALGE